MKMTLSRMVTCRIRWAPLLMWGCAALVFLGCEEAVIDVQPSFGGKTIGDQVYVEGRAITALMLPEATDGDGDLSYDITPTVPGLRFESTTRRYYGTPRSAGTYRMRYTAEDDDGDEASLTFTITVTQGPAPPPPGTNSISVGSSGYASLRAGTKSGEVGIFVVDQDNDPVTSTNHLNAANISVEVRRVSSRSSSDRGTWEASANGASASDIRVTYRGNVAGQAISYALTLDRSGSMDSSDIRNMEEAARSFVGNMRTGDEGAIINFDNSVNVDQDLTSDTSLLISAIENSSVRGGGTALFDSIGRAVSLVENGVNPTKAVVCMTDGREGSSSSFRSVDAVVNHATGKGVPVHCVGIGGANERILNGITGRTGGLYFPSPSSATLTALYRSISRALSATWHVEFTAAEVFEPGATYEIKVTVTYDNGITDSVTVTNEV